MKKKIVSLCLVIALLAIAVTGATFAYLQDSDKDVNVMVAGNVKIVQNETDREGNAWNADELADGGDGKVSLLPAVYYEEVDGKLVPYTPVGSWGVGPNGGEAGVDGLMPDTDGEGETAIYDEAIRNEVDKVISVTNTGTEPAYIRTIILMEVDDADGNGTVHFGAGKRDGQYPVILNETVTIEGVEYYILVSTYNTPLAAGETSIPSLKQIWLDPRTTNDWYESIDGEYTIIAISQAVQSDGFDDAATALNLAFGEVTAENVLDWYNNTNIETDALTNVIG